MGFIMPRSMPRKGFMRFLCRSVAFLTLFVLGALYSIMDTTPGDRRAEAPTHHSQDRNIASAAPILESADIFVQTASTSRRLLSTCSFTTASSCKDESACMWEEGVQGGAAGYCTVDPFPNALSSGNEWQVVIHIPIILYVFLALAIICDEYFVPALEIVCDEDNLNLSDDVAGATFMAAGGSAPELFTSFIGTMEESSVGFGTIVGSAVFNVLFVIAMCAFFSKDLLTLTWWPLARDSTYYTISLLVLALFFGYISENEIEWWEALILFSMYFGYVVLMVYNERLYVALGFGDKEADSGDVKKDETFENPLHVGVMNSDVEKKQHHHRQFRAGILSLVMQGVPMKVNDQAAMHVVTKIEGDLVETWDRLSKGEGNLASLDLKVLFEEIDVNATEEQIADIRKELDTNGDGQICFEEFKTWYNKSEDRVRAEMQTSFDKISRVSMMEDPDCIDMQGLRAVLKDLGGLGDMSEEAFDQALDLAMVQIDTNDDGLIQRDEFYAWYQTSMFWSMKNKKIEDASSDDLKEEDDEVDPLTWPSEASCAVKTMWIFSAPLAFLFAYTVPDCKDTEGAVFGCPIKKLAWPAFTLSIAWIGIASYFMVMSASIVGDTFGIPAQVMGLTFLAAGTSVPDLLSSIVVAQQGKGDMAVSSSIGSNIFDVLVGLPLPWLTYCAIKQQSVLVGAKSLQLSVLILVGMLVAVILLIKISGWALTKTLGGMMLVLYFLFVIQDLLRDETLICDGGCF